MVWSLEIYEIGWAVVMPFWYSGRAPRRSWDRVRERERCVYSTRTGFMGYEVNISNTSDLCGGMK